MLGPLACRAFYPEISQQSYRRDRCVIPSTSSPHGERKDGSHQRPPRNGYLTGSIKTCRPTPVFSRGGQKATDGGPDEAAPPSAASATAKESSSRSDQMEGSAWLKRQKAWTPKMLDWASVTYSTVISGVFNDAKHEIRRCEERKSNCDSTVFPPLYLVQMAP